MDFQRTVDIKGRGLVHCFKLGDGEQCPQAGEIITHDGKRYTVLAVECFVGMGGYIKRDIGVRLREAGNVD